jgi:hypothetical protein
MTSLHRCRALTLALIPLSVPACGKPSSGSLATTSNGAHGSADVDPADAPAQSSPPLDARDAACRTIASAPRLPDWPAVQSPIRKDPVQEARIQRIVASMTIEQKVGQMTQAEIRSIPTPSSRAGNRSSQGSRAPLAPATSRTAPMRRTSMFATSTWSSP